MSALETVKELGRMATTATLTKDVIDLFKEKVALLRDQVAAPLEQEKSVLQTENTNLKQKVIDLEQEIEHIRPKGDLDKESVDFLRLLANQRGLDIGQIANALNISKVRAEYHRDKLMRDKLIGYHGSIVVAGDEAYALKSKGREYLVTHGHI